MRSDDSEVTHGFKKKIAWRKAESTSNTIQIHSYT